MGTFFGREGVQEPKYTLLQKEPFEIRNYEAYIVAEVPMFEDDNSGFSILASYIGVWGNPQNQSRQQMSMTAPVIESNGEKMDMTAPVLQQEQKMAFVLPL